MNGYEKGRMLRGNLKELNFIGVERVVPLRFSITENPFGKESANVWNRVSCEAGLLLGQYMEIIIFVPIISIHFCRFYGFISCFFVKLGRQTGR